MRDFFGISSFFRLERNPWLGFVVLALLGSTVPSCGPDTLSNAEEETGGGDIEGKADAFAELREYGVFLTAPYCDVCTQPDKDYLRSRSPITLEVIRLIDGAQQSVDAAQFTFSVREIADALRRAHERGVAVRLVMDSGQDRDGTRASELRSEGLNVQFAVGRPDEGQGYSGLVHAKFMVIDEAVLLVGSNNWSSTGTSINEENTITIASQADDPLIAAHRCYFDHIWSNTFADAASCSTEEVAFSPSSAPFQMIRTAIRESTTSVDVLMHHLTYSRLVRELTSAAERGVHVRVIANVADRADYTGGNWDAFGAAGGQIRFKQHNEDMYQLMHHKLVIVDGRVSVNGTGNWSGSGFFNNYETYIRYEATAVVGPLQANFDRLWHWSLEDTNLDADGTAAQQWVADYEAMFGNLHAHFEAELGGQVLDDGAMTLRQADGVLAPVEGVLEAESAAHYAFRYGRDRGLLDFMALSPHCTDDLPDADPNQANMSPAGYAELVQAARDVTEESGGVFVALPAMEWNTNTRGNHVNIFGSTAVAKVARDDFAALYGDFLPDRQSAGDYPLLSLNHPRTFQVDPESESLRGAWDQIFGVPIPELPTTSQRSWIFNDYGLDDFPPLVDVRASWIAGEAMPDETVVAETLINVWTAAAPFVRTIEVTLARGTDLASEVPENSSLVLSDDGETIVRRTRVHTDFDYYLLRGFVLAPIASHDNHYANWGTGHTSRTGVIATARTEDGILEAIDARRVFASEDQNLSLSFFADHRVPMGSDHLTQTAETAFQLYLSDPDYAGAYQVTVYVAPVGGAEVTIAHEMALTEAGWSEFTLSFEATGRSAVYVEVLEVEANRMAWSAPIWVERL